MKDLVKIRFEEDFDINTEYVAIPEEVYKNYQVVIKQYQALNNVCCTTPRSRIKVYAEYIIEDLVPRYEKKYPELFAEWLGDRDKNSLTITDCVEFEFYIGYKNI